MTSTWLGTDIVTLCLAVPLFIAAVILAGRGSTRAFLICLGLFESSLYNFGFYLFGAAFNSLFMVYAALFGLSIWALYLGLKNLDIEKLSKLFKPKTPVKAIGAFMIFIGLGLASVYFSQWLGFVMTGKLPDIIIKTAHPTNVVFGLDLSLVVPLFIAGGIWLWQRKPWGFALAAIANVKGAVYMVGLCAATWTAFRAGTVKRSVRNCDMGDDRPGVLYGSAGFTGEPEKRINPDISLSETQGLRFFKG